MNRDERARWQAARMRAAWLSMEASKAKFVVSVIEATAAMRSFGEAIQNSINSELAEHPDMAELNVQLDGFYGTPEQR